MDGTWMLAVETAADALGEMLIEVAEGRGDHSNEDMAAAVLSTGLSAMLGSDPSPDRLEDVASVLYAKLHDGGEHSWGSLTRIEKGFGWTLPRARYAPPTPRCCATPAAARARACPERPRRNSSRVPAFS